MSILEPYNSKELMEEYKEHGLEFRHHDTQISAANRLMLPPLVIGLLVLYGEVDKFLGVEFKNPEAAHLLIWSGCLIISLIWVFNVSRTAQLIHSHLETRRKNSEIFGLRGHAEIYERDKNSSAPNILRHYNIRLVGFGIYFALLLNFTFRYMDFNTECATLSIIVTSFIAILLGGGLSIWIRRLYFNENNRYKLKPNDYIILLILVTFLTGFLTLIELYPNANAHLMRGLQFSASRDYDKAIEAYDKAIKIKPDYAKAYALRGEAHRATGDDEHSKSDSAISNALCKE